HRCESRRVQRGARLQPGHTGRAGPRRPGGRDPRRPAETHAHTARDETSRDDLSRDDQEPDHWSHPMSEWTIEVGVLRLHADAQLPERGTRHAAGWDLHAVESLTLEPGARALVGTGIS